MLTLPACACGARQRPVRITEEPFAPHSDMIESAAVQIVCDRCGGTLVDWQSIPASEAAA
jgi:hypothetical protein